MKFLLGILCLGLALHAEDLLSRQSGQAVPPGVWTRINPVGGPFFPTYQSYDNFAYNAVTGRTFALDTYKDITTETNRTLFGYSAEKNRWDLFDQASTSHDEHMLEGGHGDNLLVTDPTMGFLWLLSGGHSASSAGEFTYANWQYDPVAQAGRVKQSMLRTFVASKEYSAQIDYVRGVMVQHGTGGTQEYNLLNNTWGAPYCASGGAGCPPSNLLEACMVWNSADQSIYLFGGINSTTVQNTLYRNSGGTWSVIPTTGTGPSARAWPGCAYDTRHNKLLVYGGCTTGGNCGTSNLSDTFILDFATNTWSAGPAGPTPPSNVQQIAEKLVYDERMDAFIAGIVTSTAPNYQLWALRLYSGQNFGYKTGASYTQAPGNISVSPAAWAKKPWITVNGTTALLGWDETGIPSDSTDSQFEHPYAATIQTGSVVFVPSPVSFSAMMPLVGGATTLSNEVSCVYVGTTPWCAWIAHNTSSVNYFIYAEGYDGTGWNLGGQVAKVNIGGSGNNFPTHTVMLNVNGVPTLVFQEEDRAMSAPYRNFVYAKQCTGSPCTWGPALGGTYLNRTTASSSLLPKADSIAAAYKSGNDFFVAWSEFNAINSTQSDSPLNVYVTCWCGGAWVKYGGSVNVTPGTTNAGQPPSPPNTGDSAYQPAIRFVGGQPYVALVERNNSTPVGQQKLFIRTTANAGTTWTTVAGPLNIDTKFGWASAPSLTDDGGSNLIVAWAEQGATAPWTSALSTTQGAFGERPRIYVDQVTTSGAVTRLGGTLNASLTGAAVSPRIDMLAGSPIVAWSEVQLGTMRQVYAKKWTGADWASVSATGLSVATASLPPTTATAAYSQTLAASGGTPPYTWAITSGALPAGLTLASGTGIISGTSTTAASSSFTVQATDSVAATATQALSILVNAVPAVSTSSPMPGGTTGVAYSQTLANSGGTAPFTWAITAGALPAGLTLTGASGAIGGTPQTGGLANFTARIADSAGVAGSKAFTLTIASNLAVTTATPMTSGTVSGAYSQTLTGSGGFGADNWAVTSGTLPAGLTLAGSTGIISGTATAAATSNFTAQATDAGANTASKALAITINASSPVITTASPMARGAVNMAYSQTLTSTGGTAPFTWSITGGALPAGLTLAGSTGIISGTPTVAAASNFTALVTDSLSLSGSKDLSITTNPPGASTLAGEAVLKNRITLH